MTSISSNKKGKALLSRQLSLLAVFALAIAVLVSTYYPTTTPKKTYTTKPEMTISRSIVKKVLAIEQSEGVGAKVRRSIGTHQLRNFTPFLMLDNFKVTEGAGFPDHPHRGMTTLTYLIKGEFEHQDFVGHRGKLGPGDLQFMIAGKGIMHAEMPIHTKGGDDPFGLQLWIDLPSQYKMVDPSYQELKASEIPTAYPGPGVNIKVICGEANDAEKGIIKSPVRPLGGCWFLDYVFEEGQDTTVFQLIPQRWNTFIYTLEGGVIVDNAAPVEQYHTLILSNTPDQTGISLKSNGSKTRFVVVSGEPLDQDIFQHGPFVMDSQMGIQQAFQDFRSAKNGFEGAHNWESEIGKRMQH